MYLQLLVAFLVFWIVPECLIRMRIGSFPYNCVRLAWWASWLWLFPNPLHLVPSFVVWVLCFASQL